MTKPQWPHHPASALNQINSLITGHVNLQTVKEVFRGFPTFAAPLKANRTKIQQINSPAQTSLVINFPQFENFYLTAGRRFLKPTWDPTTPKIIINGQVSHASHLGSCRKVHQDAVVFEGSFGTERPIRPEAQWTYQSASVITQSNWCLHHVNIHLVKSFSMGFARVKFTKHKETDMRRTSVSIPGGMNAHLINSTWRRATPRHRARPTGHTTQRIRIKRPWNVQRPWSSLRVQCVVRRPWFLNCPLVSINVSWSERKLTGKMGWHQLHIRNDGLSVPSIQVRLLNGASNLFGNWGDSHHWMVCIVKPKWMSKLLLKVPLLIESETPSR